MLFGGIEAGGTKFECVIAGDPFGIVAETQVRTTSPEDTLRRVIEFFRPSCLDRKIEAIGCHRTQLPQMGDWEARIPQWAADTGAKAGMAFAESYKRIAFRPASHVKPDEARDEE